MLLNPVSVKASRQTKTMFGLFWELCTVRSGMCLKQFTRIFHLCVCKGKAIPLQAWTGPGGSRRLRLPDFKTIGT